MTAVPQAADEAPLVSTPWVVPIGAAAGLPADEVGLKARNLSRMERGGLPVPDGFVVTAAAWRAFARQSGLDRACQSALAGATRERLPALAGELAARCLSAPLPPGLESQVAAAWSALRAARVAVRSSALDEDGEDASAAGQFRSLLDRRSVDEVLSALRATWASQLAAPALTYLLDRGALRADPAMAVVVQRMVAAEAAGVLFSQRGAQDLLVEAVPGLGDALVDGAVNPERVALSPAGEPRTPLGPGSVLDAATLLTLARLARRVEAVLGPGLDLEWAREAGRVELLQARPITRSVRPGGEGRVRWTAANTQEALVDPVTPLTWSLLAPLVEAGRRDLFRLAGFAEIEGPGYMRLFGGVPYFNPDYFRRFLDQIPGLSRNVFDALIFGEGARELTVSLPRANARTLRLLLLFLLVRVAARERFELFGRVFMLRLGRLTKLDLGRLSDEELLAVRRRATRLLEGALRRHVLGTAISGAAYLLLDMFLRRSGAEPALGSGLVARLTAGASGNAVAVGGVRLEELARAAARQEALAGVLAGGWSGAGPEPGWEADLARAGVQGRWLLAELRRFLREHGHRCEKEAELLEPRWGDDPAVLLRVLASLVRAVRAEAPVRRQRHDEPRLRREARRLAGRVTRFLRGESALERWLPARQVAFRLLLREARRYAPYRENLKDRALRALHQLRRVFLEAGQRLVRRGLLAAPEEVFFLEIGEVEAALLGRAGPGLSELVAARRAERAAQLAAGQPPRHVIEVPGAAPRPVHESGERGAGLLEGVGVSGGKVSGVARVLAGTHEAARLGPGEIVVARVVNAGWTPLFHLAGGIVAEVGGVLSHAAIVAREYGLPAVFGAAGAARIPDGARITVDGDLGIVTIDEADAPARS